MSAHLVRGVRLVRRHRAYRRYIRARLILGAAAGIRPFFIVFGSKAWGLSDEVAGVFLAIQLGAEIVGSALAGQTSDRVGNRSVIIMAAIALSLAAAIACLAAVVSCDPGLGPGEGLNSLKVLVLGAPFAGSGFFMASPGIGSINYIMDIAPDRQRPSYIAVSQRVHPYLRSRPLVDFAWFCAPHKGQTIGALTCLSE